MLLPHLRMNSIRYVPATGPASIPHNLRVYLEGEISIQLVNLGSDKSSHCLSGSIFWTNFSTGAVIWFTLIGALMFVSVLYTSKMPKGKLSGSNPQGIDFSYGFNGLPVMLTLLPISRLVR